MTHEKERHMREWQQTGFGNLVLEGDGFTISYNPDCSAGLVGFIDRLIGIDQLEETALIVGGTYLILNGDHRQEYERMGDLKSCMEYFESHQDLVSPTSDTVDELN